MEKINWESFSDSHARIRERILELIKVLDENTKRHIQRGLYMRLGMMESAITSFDSKIGNSTEPLQDYLVYELSLLLNAYYLNLVGSLDNIAWALTYHHKLRDQIDEKDRRIYQFVNINGNKFLQKLREKGLNDLAAKLSTIETWFNEVKDFRDPAAHRIPLYVPLAILSANDLQERNRLDNQTAELIRNGKYTEGVHLEYKMRKTGKHFPIFFTESPMAKAHNLATQINKYHQNWLNIVKDCLELGF